MSTRHDPPVARVTAAVVCGPGAGYSTARMTAEPLYAFHVCIHPRPAAAVPLVTHADAWGTWPTLACPREAMAGTFPVGVDAVLEGLAGLPRMYVEPDGAIVWTSGDPCSAWQVDGTLFERDGRLSACELKGSCPAHAFDCVLTAFGWPATPVMVELVRAGVFLEEATFRRHAIARGSAGDAETLRPS